MIKEISNKAYVWFLLGYILILGGFSFFIFPSHDILYYYYPWSQKLQLSYFDGPPLIAYVIRASTLIFGQTKFALNIWGVFVACLSCYAIIRIGKILDSLTFGILAALCWLTYPFSTTRFIFITLNYDCLDNLFSLFTLLYTLEYLQEKKKRSLLLVGVSAGLLLLAKYTGVVLLLGILVYFVASSNERKIFKSPYFYLASLICLLIFSPVLIWNYQHDWMSFKYQLTTHEWSQGTYKAAAAGWSGVLFYIMTDVLGVMHVMLILLVWTISKQRDSAPYAENSLNGSILKLIWTIIVVYFLFWLKMSYTAHIAMNYLISFDSILLILANYYLIKSNYKKVVVSLIILFFMISLGMLIKRAFINKPELWDLNLYKSLNLSQ